MLNKIEGTRYVYKNKDGKAFKLKRRTADGWVEMRVGDPMRIDGRDFKIVEITPTAVTVVEIITGHFGQIKED